MTEAEQEAADGLNKWFAAHDVIEAVEETVSPVYLVGGSVRDMLLNKEPKDYDFCTPLSPEEVEAKVREAGRRPYLTGQRFGTIGFKCAGQFIEVTTFRSEKYNPGSRKPEVEFVTDLKEDLSRRDFTINAIAYHNQEFIDPFGGRLDILAKKIKAVGEATDRFKEDPLRMLRAARFVAQLDFEIDPNMIGKIRKMPQTILGISRERWVQELDKLLVADNAQKGIQVLFDTYLLKYMLPELWNIGQANTLYQVEAMYHTMNNLLAAPKDADIRWAILLQYIGMPYVWKQTKTDKLNYPFYELVSFEMAKGIGQRLKFSNKRMEIIENVIRKQTVFTNTI